MEKFSGADIVMSGLIETETIQDIERETNE